MCRCFQFIPCIGTVPENPEALCAALLAFSASQIGLHWPRELPLELTLASLHPCSGEPWNGLSQPVLSELPGLLPKSRPDSPWNRTPLIPEPDSWMHIPNSPIVSGFFSPLSQKFGNWETQMRSRMCIHPPSDKRVKGFLPGWGWQLLCANLMKMTQRSQS